MDFVIVDMVFLDELLQVNSVDSPLIVHKF
jgi:hypothetical protein